MDSATSGLEFPFVEQVRPSSSRGWMLNRDRLTIGRNANSDLRIDDPHVSGHHADLVRWESGWAIVDADSFNGTYVNGAKVREATLREGDRITVGTHELILRMPASAVDPPPTPPPIRYDVGSQFGNVSNVAGNQSNYMTESNLRYIASRRGRARLLIVWGIVLFMVGQGLALAAVLSFQGSIFEAIDSANPSRGPDLPEWFLPGAGAGAFMTLIGIGMFIFGLIARSGAKREARRLGTEWS